MGPAVTIDASLDLHADGSFETTGSGTVANGTCIELITQGSAGDLNAFSVSEVAVPNYTTTWKLTQRTSGTDVVTTGSGATVTGLEGGTAGALVEYTNTLIVVPPTGNQGCTPGYWKQSQHFDSWVGYNQTDLVNTIFGVTYNPKLPKGQGTFDGTMLGALGLGGGGQIAMMRAATAALLNASGGSGVKYPYTTAQIIKDVQDAFAGLVSFDAINTKYDGANNGAGGCPLN